MVTLQNAWDSYLLLLTSLKKSAATKKQYNLVGQQFLVFASERNIYQLDDQFKELLFTYNKYLQGTYANVNTYNHKIATLRSFVDFVFLREWLERFDYEVILQPKKRGKESLKVLTKEQLVKISAVWPTYFQYAKTNEHAWLARRNGCIVQMLLETGCKPSELVHMKWSDIKEQESHIYLSNHNGRRALKISTILLEMLHYYKEATEVIHQEPIGEWIWVSEASQMKPITTKTIERIFQTISKDIGVAVRATDIRYTVMQKALQNENSIENTLQQMGYVRKWVLTERGDRFD
ncbi:tyrosine-type recombinase/integrase [Lysinibacillus sp. NPDC097287]|uniref:tyrosine-type recombinase/integrase n=1 Tax=Lysinibacillus sp. NPDC097287 TaxID=3364144 RepID=UPI0038236BBB